MGTHPDPPHGRSRVHDEDGVEDISRVYRIEEGHPDQGEDDIEHNENTRERRCGESVRHGVGVAARKKRKTE